MRRNTASWVISIFFVMAISVATAAAQLGTPIPGQHPNGAQAHPGSGNPACQRIVAECKRLGFIQGEWKRDNGLWRDCFDPVVHGGTPTRDGHPVEVPVSPSDVQACRSAQANRR